MENERYGISTVPKTDRISAPDLDYRPARSDYRPGIGLIGAGGITEYHLKAYQNRGLDVVAFTNRDREKAVHRRDTFYPQAAIDDSIEELLARPEVDVVDIALPPKARVAAIEAAIRAGKHVLSQKPFVEDLDVGERLVALADEHGVKLAVNQNGRWAPHHRYIAQAIRGGLLGDIGSIDFTQQWDHTWTVGTPFEEIHHLLLYDFGIHWFDLAQLFTGEGDALSVYATVRKTKYQQARPPFLAQAMIDYPATQVRICFNAHVTYGQEDRVVVSGEKGTIRSWGEGLNQHQVNLITHDGEASPKLEGEWLSEGFQGAMMELIQAVEENREPENSARNNLKSLALCFAALRSADTGMAQTVETSDSMP